MSNSVFCPKCNVEMEFKRGCPYNFRVCPKCGFRSPIILCNKCEKIKRRLESIVRNPKVYAPIYSMTEEDGSIVLARELLSEFDTQMRGKSR